MLGRAAGGRSPRCCAFLNGNDHFFLNLTMPSAKCTVDAAAGDRGHPRSSPPWRGTARSSASGCRDCGERWFTGPGQRRGRAVPARVSPPRTRRRDIGDSVITETSGIGGFAMAAAPAIVKFVGGTPGGRPGRHPTDVRDHRGGERRLPHPGPGLPGHADRHRRAARWWRPASCRPSTPASPTRSPAIGMVGAGLVKPPENCFRDAVLAFAEKYGR
ncbi:MAG: DUF1116 domain-containing protein [Anaerotruncus sp.]|nr:DUF1116 domain-containing protein [Anaerotruncus sp.]